MGPDKGMKGVEAKDDHIGTLDHLHILMASRNQVLRCILPSGRLSRLVLGTDQYLSNHSHS